MKSKAHINGHPIHPILVSFPIALLIAVVILDVIFIFSERQSFWQAAGYAEAGGLIFGVLAALAGIIDYIFTVPPKSSASKRAARHGLLNSAVMILFLMAFVFRTKEVVNTWYIIGMELLGAALLTVAGWLGGTLVVRNQIGVDHRYAEAGKWQEQNLGSSDNGVELKELEQLKVNQMKLILVNDKRIVLARTEEGLVAFDDRCTHRGASLADGVMICGTVQCPWHGSQFSAKDGSVKAGPAKDSIRTYELKTENGKVWLKR